MWIALNFVGVFALFNYFFINSNGRLFNFASKLVGNKRISWENYRLIYSDLARTGFGEHGKGESLTDSNEIKENEELFKTFGMSVVISDKISVNRSIPDFRHPKCLKKKYFKNLPRVSIVIIYVNEVFSMFKRTLHSLYNRTPHELIQEVILVNDNSTLDFLYDPLKEYIDQHFPNLTFNIINLKQRQGLMKARVIGAKAAKSEFVFMMEPHCEMTYNWLPPLIEPLLNEERIVTVPIIDNVECNQLKYYENELDNEGCRGVFNWKLNYQKMPRIPVSGDRLLDPFLTPIMTGGIFMIRKKYFFELGPYDEELLIWGAENIELSLKIHLCGGKLLEVPCSRIGHAFRKFNTFRKHETGIDYEHFNQKRIIEVWFEDYKKIVYDRRPENFELDVGDLTKQKKLRNKLNCKPFQYFLDVIAPDLLRKFPLEIPPFATGRVQLQDTNFCLESAAEPDMKLMLNKCSELTWSQEFENSWYRDIRVKKTELCLDFHETMITVCE